MKIHACSPTAVRYRTAFPTASARPSGQLQPRHPNTPVDQRKTRPAANVVREENGYRIEIALPGVPKEQVSVSVHDGFLTVKHQVAAAQETGGRFTRKEFDYSGFERRFRLPNTVDGTRIEARFESGILHLVLPERKPEIKPIEIQ